MCHFTGHDVHREVDRETQDGADHVRAHYRERRVLLAAPRPVPLREGDGDVAPHGQRHRQPDRDRVERLTEDGVEVHEHGPAVRVAVDLRPDLDVHVQRVGDVLQHDEQVGHGQAREDGVGGAGHLAARQHGDVDGVGDGADHADGHGDVAVQPAVAAVEVAGAGHAVGARVARHDVTRRATRPAAPLPPSRHLKQYLNSSVYVNECAVMLFMSASVKPF